MRHAIVVMLVLAACGKSEDKPLRQFEQSKADIARVTAKKYAYEAYPQWAAAHADKECPDTITALDEYVNAKDHVDPWGHAYLMKCGKDLPAGVRGMAVSSAGPDGTPGTDDDITSWK